MLDANWRIESILPRNAMSNVNALMVLILFWKRRKFAGLPSSALAEPG